MGRRRCAAPLVFALIALIMSGCHASTEVSSDRSLAVCVGIQSSSGLGPTRPASAARVFAIVNGNEVDLAFDEVDGECARFTADLFMSDEVSSITAFDPSVGASTLIDVSTDEVNLRINDAKFPMDGASTVKLKGTIIRSSADTSVTISGEGVDNSWVYGNYNNLLQHPPNTRSFELDVGSWDGAPPTFIFFVERDDEDDMDSLPRIGGAGFYRVDDITPFIINLSTNDMSRWRPAEHRSRLADGLLNCDSIRASDATAHNAPQRGVPRLVRASLTCEWPGEILVEGFVHGLAPWLIHNYDFTMDSLSSIVAGTVFIRSSNEEDYIIPNISAFELDVFGESGVSGSVSISGSTPSSFLNLHNLINTNERDLPWNIYTERNDGITIDKDEYALIRNAIEEVIEVQSIKYMLVIRDGYEGKPWETAPVHALSHHSLFSMQLLPPGAGADAASP